MIYFNIFNNGVNLCFLFVWHDFQSFYIHRIHKARFFYFFLFVSFLNLKQNCVLHKIWNFVILLNTWHTNIMASYLFLSSIMFSYSVQLKHVLVVFIFSGNLWWVDFLLMIKRLIFLLMHEVPGWGKDAH